MASRVVFVMANKLKLVKARVRGVIQDGRNVHSRSKNGCLKPSSQFIRLIMHDHGEGSSRLSSTREKGRAASDYAAHKRLEHGSTLREAVTKLMDRVNQGFTVNSYSYNHVLQWCSKEKDLESVKLVHASIKDSRMEQHLYVANMFLKCYIECGRLETAKEFFNKLAKKDTVSWNTMIAGLAKNDQAEGAIDMYNQMQNAGGQPSAVTYLSVLKACTSPTALRWGKDIHAHIRRDGFQADVRVCSALVCMYANCGSIEDARAVFGTLVRRDVVSWTVMIGGLAQHGLGRQAFSLFLQMQREGCKPQAITYLNILNPCSSTGAIEWVKEVHAHAIKEGLDVDLRVGTALVQMYAKSGSIEDARAVFGRLGRRDVFSWNVLIGGLAEHGLGHEAFSMFLHMQREGFTPDAITYLNILNPCSSTDCLEWVKGVHAHAVEVGIDVDVQVGNALIQMYAKCGSIEDARAVFRRLRGRDVSSWTVLIGGLAANGLGHEAFSLLLQMQREGFTPQTTTYLSILNPSASTGAVEWVKKIHAHAMEVDLDVDLRVGSALVQMYAKSGSIEDARVVFGRLGKRDVFSWNVMIGGLAEHGLGDEAFSLFLQMRREGFTPDAITYLSILNPCSSFGAAEWVKEIHARAMEVGLDVDVRVGTALVQMYAKIGSIEDARAVFGQLCRRDVVSWSVMIGGLAQHGLGNEAFSLFLQMQREGFTPDPITYLNILSPSLSPGGIEWVSEVHAHAREAGLDVDLRVGNALVQMYAKCGSIEDARAVFCRLGRRDLFSWNVMIGGLAEHGLGHEAFSMFLQMQREGFIPDAITYLSILNPCSSVGAIEWVKEVHAHAREVGLDVDVRVGSAFVQMYARTGLIADAKQVFDKIQIRDVISEVVMISGLGQHGHGREALELFERIKAKGVKPNDALFVAVLSACSHAGLVEEGLLLFDSMRREHGIEAALEHYNCIVDMFGRAGRLKEAYRIILNMPIKPDEVTWTAFLGACRTHKNIELAALAAKECLKLKPADAPPFVLLSNVYAAVGDWDQVRLIRSMMQKRGLRKDPGRCWIEVSNKLHHFVGGDTTHSETREIYTVLSSLSEKLKTEGYIADTRLVLRNIAEEDKESAICSHSETLAIAYGLMHVPPEKPIRVYKNLRICTDCHTATKLISKITGREIVARDVNRFHHFKDGCCSCGDYW